SFPVILVRSGVVSVYMEIRTQPLAVALSEAIERPYVEVFAGFLRGDVYQARFGMVREATHNRDGNGARRNIYGCATIFNIEIVGLHGPFFAVEAVVGKDPAIHWSKGSPRAVGHKDAASRAAVFVFSQ